MKTKYEYHVLQFYPSSQTTVGQAVVLNRFAAEGWRVIKIVVIHSATVLVYLERELV